MVKINKEKLKQIPKMCILEDNKICDNCCECFVCDVNPGKICDNCGKCLEVADFNEILIYDLLLEDDL